MEELGAKEGKCAGLYSNHHGLFNSFLLLLFCFFDTSKGNLYCTKSEWYNMIHAFPPGRLFSSCFFVPC